MIFWITASALALATLAILALAVLRRRDADEHPASFDLRVYRDQLKEVDRDLARGLINQGDAERSRTEISRRILAADAQIGESAQSGADDGRASVPLIAALAIVLVGGSLLGYRLLGAPGYGDKPLLERLAQAQERMDSRPSQAELESLLPPSPPITPSPEFLELMDQLRDRVAANPEDVQGLELLAQNEESLGNYRAAYQAQVKVIRLKGKYASALDYTVLANMMISAAQGPVSPEAQEALRRALELKPQDPLARYFWGLLMLQNDRPDLTFRIWEDVLRVSPPNAPWIGAIRSQIKDLAWFAGVEYKSPTPPAADTGLPGPTVLDMDAAGGMEAGDRQAMIRDMVENLASRLATQGGTPQEWARLITAHGVLGETGRAAAAWAEAQTAFANTPDALAIMRDAAERAGVLDR